MLQLFGGSYFLSQNSPCKVSAVNLGKFDVLIKRKPDVEELDVTYLPFDKF